MFENPIVILNALCSSFAKMAFCSSEFIFTFPKCERGIPLVQPHLFFLTSLFIQQHKQNASYVWRFKQLSLGNHLELDTCSYLLYFNDRHLSPPKLRITLCM